jgi:UDP-N-acetylmuramoyl-tripeptide--D-alanyl-D-alanine ligase
MRHSIEDFIRETGAKCFSSGDLGFDSIHFDSRKIEKGMLFLALLGENADGHDFISQAIENGAAGILGSRKDLDIPDGIFYLYHPNPLSALQEYASWYRQSLDAVIIGVTGSFGKTTTKDFLSAFLPNCARNLGNFNNTLGLPLSVVCMDRTHDFGVFEMGISTPGEMEILARILKPDHMVITAFGSVHCEFFKDQNALIAEKLKCQNHFREHSRVYFPQSLSSCLEGRLKGIPVEVIEGEFWPDFRASMGVGPHRSCCLAAKVASEMGMSPGKFKTPPLNVLSPYRMQREKLGEMEVILDCYNASPETTLAFLDSVCDNPQPVIVLADMLELGKNALEFHKSILKHAIKAGFSEVFLVGENYQNALKDLDTTGCFTLCGSVDEVIGALRDKTPQRLALKGSRRFKLERVYEALKEG